MKLLRYEGFIGVSLASGLWGGSVIGAEAMGKIELRGEENILNVLSGKAEARFKLGRVSKLSYFLKSSNYEWTEWEPILLTGNPVIIGLNRDIALGVFRIDFSDDRRTLGTKGRIDIKKPMVRWLINSMNVLGRASLMYSGEIDVFREVER